MNRARGKDRLGESDFSTNLLAALAVVVGLLLISLGVHWKEQPLWSAVLSTVGIALVVSTSTSLLHRRFVYRAQQREMQAEVQRLIHQLLNSRFDLLGACTSVGIRHLYPKWSAFCENTLPRYLETLRENLVVVGIGLSGLSQLFVGGALRELIDRHLRSKKHVLVCTVDPKSKAAIQRENEVGQVNTTTKAIEASLAYFEDIRRANPGSNLAIKVLKTKVPRAAMICIDNEIILYSPYFSADRTPSAWVIETHEGDALFKKLRKDLDHVLSDAVEWRPDDPRGDAGEPSTEA